MSVDTVLDRSGNVRDIVNIENVKGELNFDITTLPPYVEQNIFQSFQRIYEPSIDHGIETIRDIPPDHLLAASIVFPKRLNSYSFEEAFGQAGYYVYDHAKMLIEVMQEDKRNITFFDYSLLATLKLSNPAVFESLVTIVPNTFNKFREEKIYTPNQPESLDWDFQEFLFNLFHRKILFPDQDNSPLLRRVFKELDKEKLNQELSLKNKAILKLLDQNLFKELGLKVTQEEIDEYIEPVLENNVDRRDPRRTSQNAIKILSAYILSSDRTEITPNGTIQIVYRDQIRLPLSTQVPDIERFQE